MYVMRKGQCATVTVSSGSGSSSGRSDLLEGPPNELHAVVVSGRGSGGRGESGCLARWSIGIVVRRSESGNPHVPLPLECQLDVRDLKCLRSAAMGREAGGVCHETIHQVIRQLQHQILHVLVQHRLRIHVSRQLLQTRCGDGNGGGGVGGRRVGEGTGQMRGLAWRRCWRGLRGLGSGVGKRVRLRCVDSGVG